MIKMTVKEAVTKSDIYIESQVMSVVIIHKIC